MDVLSIFFILLMGNLVGESEILGHELSAWFYIVSKKASKKAFLPEHYLVFEQKCPA